jgi:hypothetical protein
MIQTYRIGRPSEGAQICAPSPAPSAVRDEFIALLQALIRNARTVRVVPSGGIDRYQRRLGRLYIDGATWPTP